MQRGQARGVEEQRAAIAAERERVRARVQPDIDRLWAEREARQAEDAAVGRAIVETGRERRAQLEALRVARAASAAADDAAGDLEGEDGMATKKTATKKGTPRRVSGGSGGGKANGLSDEQIKDAVARHLEHDPKARTLTIVKALQAKGHPVSGSRVRAAWDALTGGLEAVRKREEAERKNGTAAPAAARKPTASKPTATKGRGAAGNRPNSAAGAKRTHGASKSPAFGTSNAAPKPAGKVKRSAKQKVQARMAAQQAATTPTPAPEPTAEPVAAEA